MFSSRSSISAVAVAPTSSSLIADSWRSFSAAPGWSAYIARRRLRGDARTALGLVGLRRLLPALAPRLGLLEQGLVVSPNGSLADAFVKRSSAAADSRASLSTIVACGTSSSAAAFSRPPCALSPSRSRSALSLASLSLRIPCAAAIACASNWRQNSSCSWSSCRRRVVEPFQDVLVEPGSLRAAQEHRRDARGAEAPDERAAGVQPRLLLDRAQHADEHLAVEAQRPPLEHHHLGVDGLARGRRRCRHRAPSDRCASAPRRPGCPRCAAAQPRSRGSTRA